MVNSPPGPKVNTVEKLAELRRAGVNVGEYICRLSCLFCVIK